MNTFEDRLNYLSTLMDQDPLSEDIQTLAMEVKESCTTQTEKHKLEVFLARGIAKLSSDVELLYKKTMELANS